jgi:hypothetical protein
MRYLTARCPRIERILLVESGNRSITERVLPKLSVSFTDLTSVDVITCYGGVPAGLAEHAAVYRTQDHATAAERANLLRRVRESGATVVAMICSDEQIMTRWKWWLAAKLPAKILIVNENADYFWLDTAHIGYIKRFALKRLGLSGQFAGRTVARVAAFPAILAYLLTYAAVTHLRRAWRIRFEKT